MRPSPRSLLVFALLGAIAIATWLAGRPPAGEIIRSSSSAGAPAGYYLKDATLLGTNEQGQVYYTVFAAELRRISRADDLLLEDVRVEYAPETGVRWSLTAGRGTAPSDHMYLDLEQNVRLFNGGDGDPVTLETDAMRLDTQTYLASTDADVVLQWGRAGLQSTGAKVDLKQDTLDLKSNVSARFPP